MRQTLGAVSAGSLIVGQISRSTGVDLFFKARDGRLPGNRLDAALRAFVDQCWATMTRKPGKPQFAKSPSGLIWLASMPLVGVYGVDDRLDGGAELYRLRPVMRRPRGIAPTTEPPRPKAYGPK